MASDETIEFGEPEMQQDGTTFRFAWERDGQPMLRIQIEDVRNDGDRIMGAFTVWWLLNQPMAVRPIQPYTVLNLSSSHSTGWRSIPRELSKRLANVDWEGAMTIAVNDAMEAFRAGDPTIALFEEERTNEPPFLLEPWVSSMGNTVIYGEGGLNKSLITLAMAISISTGVPIFGKEPRVTGPVIIFDYEDDHRMHVNRLLAICKSFGIPPEKAKVYHHALASKVSTAQQEMQRRITETGAILGILDSVGMGRSGSAVAAEDTIRMFRYLRTFGIPFLSIDHVSKASKDGNKSGDVDAYGSIYTMNSARLAWSLVRQVSNDGKVHILAKNKKHNHVPQQPNQSISIEYVNDELGVPDRINIETGNEFGMIMPTVGTHERLMMWLSHGEWRTYTQVAEELGIKRENLKQAVSRDRKLDTPTFETKTEGRIGWVRLNRDKHHVTDKVTDKETMSIEPESE